MATLARPSDRARRGGGLPLRWHPARGFVSADPTVPARPEGEQDQRQPQPPPAGPDDRMGETRDGRIHAAMPEPPGLDVIPSLAGVIGPAVGAGPAEMASDVAPSRPPDPASRVREPPDERTLPRPVIPRKISRPDIFFRGPPVVASDPGCAAV